LAVASSLHEPQVAYGMGCVPTLQRRRDGCCAGRAEDDFVCGDSGLWW
jgi:hypothetical protein